MRYKAINYLIFLPSLLTFWDFIGELFAPDTCLDHGGSFNYSAWECSYTENYPYIATPFFQLNSFWLFLGCLGLGLLVLRFYRT